MSFSPQSSSPPPSSPDVTSQEALPQDLPRHPPRHPSPAAALAAKERTCLWWATGHCDRPEEQCTAGVHHFFPSVTYLTTSHAEHVIKKAQCPRGERCLLPPENCGFLHDDVHPLPLSGPANVSAVEQQRLPYRQHTKQRRTRVSEQIQDQAWDVRMRFVCKREGCGAEFEDLESVVRHCRSVDGCGLQIEEGRRARSASKSDGVAAALPPKRAKSQDLLRGPSMPGSSRMRQAGHGRAESEREAKIRHGGAWRRPEEEQ